MMNLIKQKFQRWCQETEAMAAVEAGFIFPILLVMLMGTFDAGYGVLAAQKTIRASQVTADLIARHKLVNASEINEAIEAGELSMFPYDTDNYGIDITSVEFDDDGNIIEHWCETRNMPHVDMSANLMPLSVPGEGVVAVTVRFNYQPTFSGIVFNEITMQETAFVRGRLTSVVAHESGSSC